MNDKKLRILNKLSLYVSKYTLISTEAFDCFPSEIGEVIIGMIERDDDDNYSFVCNIKELSGVIDDFDFKDGYKVYLSVNGYDIDLYVIQLNCLDLN